MPTRHWPHWRHSPQVVATSCCGSAVRWSSRRPEWRPWAPWPRIPQGRSQHTPPGDPGLSAPGGFRCQGSSAKNRGPENADRPVQVSHPEDQEHDVEQHVERAGQTVVRGAHRAADVVDRHLREPPPPWGRLWEASCNREATPPSRGTGRRCPVRARLVPDLQRPVALKAPVVRLLRVEDAALLRRRAGIVRVVGAVEVEMSAPAVAERGGRGVAPGLGQGASGPGAARGEVLT